MFRVKIEISREVLQRSPPRADSHEQHRRWEKTGQLLKDYSALMVWKFTPEQLQDPDKVAEYLKRKFYGSSREAGSYAMFWALATIYWTLLVTRQHPQGEEGESRPTGTTATQTAAEPEEQPVMVGSSHSHTEEIQNQISSLSEG